MFRAQTWRFHTKLCINLDDTLQRIACEWKTADTWFLARLFTLQSSIISQILEFIYWMVTILALITWLVKTENYNHAVNLLKKRHNRRYNHNLTLRSLTIHRYLSHHKPPRFMFLLPQQILSLPGSYIMISLSQSTIGVSHGSNACTVIPLLLAKTYLTHKRCFKLIAVNL